MVGIIFLILVASSTYGTHSKASSYFSKHLDDFTSQDLKRIAFEIADDLLRDAIEDASFVKWPRIVDQPPSGWLGPWNNYFYGYWWGTAGVADTLLSFYTASQNKSYLNYAERAGNYLIDHAQNYSEHGIFWYGAENYKTTYIGMKYGNAGIALFFLHLFQATQNQTHYEVLNQTLQTLEEEALNSSQSEIYWSFTLEGIEGVTDIIYGVAGIAKVFLEAGVALNRTRWVDIAISAGKWLSNIARKTTNDTTELWNIPWSDFSPYNTSYYTGLGGGNAGIGSFFLSLYHATNNVQWLDIAKFIGNWILSKETGGTWMNGGSSYTTGLDPNLTRQNPISGMDSGVAGVGQFLLDLYISTENRKYAGGAVTAASWLIEHANSSDDGLKWAKTLAEPDSDVYLTGYSFGAAGIGGFFSELFAVFGCPKFKDAMLGAAGWLNSLRTKNDRFPVATGKTRHPFYLKQYGHHLSYYSGAAGIASFFLKGALSLKKTPLYPEAVTCLNLPEFGESLTTSISIDSSSETAPNGQINPNNQLFSSLLGFFTISLLLLFSIITLRRKKVV